MISDPLPPAALVAAHPARRERQRGRGQGPRAGRRCWRRATGAASAPTTAASARASGERYVCEQQLDGTPFERFLRERRASRSGWSPRDGDTEVTLATEQRLRGLSRLGSLMMRRATGRTLTAALDGSSTPSRAPDARGGGADAPGAAGDGATKWWGWGDGRAPPALPEAAVALLRERLGVEPGDALEPVALDPVSLPEPAPAPRGGDAARPARAPSSPAPEDRIRHAAGRSYPDLVRLRTGALERRSRRGAAARQPRAGRGGARGLRRRRGRRRPVRRRDERGRRRGAGARRALARRRARPAPARRRSRSTALSLTARLGPGPDAAPRPRRALGAQGLTLGHFPQSFEQATIGGFAATRSAGQASSGYGRFDDLVTAIELTAPAGRMRTLRDARTPPPGPSLRELVLGSEGTLGVITDVSCRVRPPPRGPQPTRAGSPPTSHAGVRDHPRPRPAPERSPTCSASPTRRRRAVSLAMAGAEGLQRRALDAYLGLRRRRGGCLMICGWEGEREVVRRRRSRRRAAACGAAARCRSAARPGRSWEHEPLRGPLPARRADRPRGHRRDARDRRTPGAGSTSSTAAVGGRAREALARRPPSIVMCHLSHVYRGRRLALLHLPDPRPAAASELEQWRAAKTAACEAIVACGGTITHHHAVGRDHAPYMRAEVGELGHRGAARGQGAPRPRRDHEPRQAASLARLALPLGWLVRGARPGRRPPAGRRGAARSRRRWRPPGPGAGSARAGRSRRRAGAGCGRLTAALQGRLGLGVGGQRDVDAAELRQQRHDRAGDRGGAGEVAVSPTWSRASGKATRSEL